MTPCLPRLEPHLLITLGESRWSDKLTLQVYGQHIPMNMVSPRLSSFYLQLTEESSVKITCLFPKERILSVHPLCKHSILQDFPSSWPGWFQDDNFGRPQCWKERILLKPKWPSDTCQTHIEKSGASLITYHELGPWTYISISYLYNGLMNWNVIFSHSFFFFYSFKCIKHLLYARQ